jgi:hypothetical protein
MRRKRLASRGIWGGQAFIRPQQQTASMQRNNGAREKFSKRFAVD